MFSLILDISIYKSMIKHGTPPHKKGGEGAIHVLCKHIWDQKLNAYSNKSPFKYHK